MIWVYVGSFDNGGCTSIWHLFGRQWWSTIKFGSTIPIVEFCWDKLEGERNQFIQSSRQNGSFWYCLFFHPCAFLSKWDDVIIITQLTQVRRVVIPFPPILTTVTTSMVPMVQAFSVGHVGKSVHPRSGGGRCWPAEPIDSWRHGRVWWLQMFVLPSGNLT